ncbi:protein kinase domain-containing protein [Nocardia sp. CA-119907]|uniref:serine/threonine-protein kinase n=1 Tax=Nocardia sp. CA-119907 TaxID=3239973 RepID=UPI003D972C94
MTSDTGRLRAALPAYDIGAQVGRGGCGVVLAGTHRRLGRPVAIKQIPPQFAHDEQVRRRFVAEARLLAAIDHPHVVRVFDYIEDDELCLLVMEYLPGGTVGSRFATEGFDAATAVAVGLACAAGLEAAHRHRILHRDVKPSNLMFGIGGAIKLTDFGIAKIVGGDRTLVTRTGEIVGTPAYIAPEQARGQPLSPATDVYALATMLYQLLSGVLPFPPSDDHLATLFAHAFGDPIPLTEVAPGVPGPIADVVMRGLATDPADRFDTAELFGIALAELAASCWGGDWLAPVGIPVIGADTIVAAATGSSRAARRPSAVTPRPGGAQGSGTRPGSSRTNASSVPLTSFGPRVTVGQPSGMTIPATGVPSSPLHPPSSAASAPTEITPGPNAPDSTGGGPIPPVAQLSPRSQPTGDAPTPARNSDSGPGGAISPVLPARGETDSGQFRSPRSAASQPIGAAPTPHPRESDPVPTGPVSPVTGEIPAGPYGPPMGRVRPRYGLQDKGVRLADVDRRDLVSIREVVTFASPRLPLLAGVLGAAGACAVAVLGLGAPTAGGDLVPGTVTIAGVDPTRSDPIDIDLSEPIPLQVKGIDVDSAALAVRVVGVRLGGDPVPLQPGGAAVLPDPVNQHVLAGHLDGELTLLRNGTEIATQRFALRTTQRPTLTAASAAIVILALFAAAYVESNTRTLRRGRGGIANVIGLSASSAMLAGAVAGGAWILRGTPPTIATLAVSAVLGAGAGVGIAFGARRIGRRRRLLRRARREDG